MEALKIKNLTKLYTNDTGIKDISLTLAEKECLAIVGKSGSGKSTLIKTILNVIDYNRGQVYFYNTTLAKDYVGLMRVIGYLPDKPYSFPKETIAAFLKKVNAYYDQDYTSSFLAYLKEFNLNQNMKIANLSSGELQKLSLILAIFHKPKILFLDEPTNFLDTLTIHHLAKILKQLKYEGTAIFIASHSLNFVLELADKIYLLDNQSLRDIKDELVKRDYKKVNLSTTKELTYKDLNIPGIRSIKLENNLASFIYMGDLSYLLKKLASFTIEDLSLENPSIEEVLGGLYHDLS